MSEQPLGDPFPPVQDDPFVELIRLFEEYADEFADDPRTPDTSTTESGPVNLSGGSRKMQDILLAAKAKEALAIAAKADRERERVEIGKARDQIVLDKETRVAHNERALDANNRVYAFTDVVSAGSVQNCINQMTLWMRQGCDPIEIVFTSPGGSVIDGMRLFDFIRYVDTHCPVTTVALGEAASMAGILLQAGRTRVVGKEAWILIHEAAFGAQGKTSDMEERVKWVKRVQERILTIFAERCQATDAPKKLTKSTIKRNWHKTDWWISSDEALDYGLVDEIR